MPDPIAVVGSLDHLVLTVTDPERTCRFYEHVLGMRRVASANGRWALHFGVQKLNLHATGQRVDANVRHATPGSADVCFLTERPVDQVAADLAASGITVIEGPVERVGATGAIRSIYIYDPDENLVEIANRI